MTRLKTECIPISTIMFAVMRKFCSQLVFDFFFFLLKIKVRCLKTLTNII